MREVQIDEIRKAYSLFEEEKSKYIFENRLMYSLTGAKKFIRNLVCTNEIGLEMYNRLKSSHQKKILFGAGKLGKRLLHVYEDIRFECFVDNFNRSQACCNLPVINFAELKKNYSDALISIVSIKYCDEMMEQLLQAGFEKKNILNFGLEYRKMNQLQYFDLPTLEESRKEVECFVDGGSYDGESTMSFVNWCKKARGGIYVWEPDLDCIEKCKQLFEEKDIAVELISKGLWSKEGTIKFKTGGRGGAISDCGDITIEVDCIDHSIKEPVTFIKLDVEGAEYQALLGAKQVISKYKPKLAICVYHKLEDIWELPGIIYKMNPEYTFYLRHYSFAENETVLYALPK